MGKQKLYYFLANVFICAAIYPIDKFLKRMIRDKRSISLSGISLLNVLEIIRIPGASFFSFISDRTQKSAHIVIFCVFGYCVSIVCLLYASNASGERKDSILTALGVGIANFFNSGIFPPLEMLVLHESLRFGNSKRTYGIMRTSSALGIITGHLSNLIKISKERDVLNYIKIVVLVSYSTLAILTLAVSVIFQHKAQEKSKAQSAEITNHGFFSRLLIILKSQYKFILIVVITQGFHRTSYSSMQALYLKSLGVKDQGAHVIFTLRVVPEIIFYIFARDVEAYIGCYWMFSLATVSALLHTMSYSVLPTNMSSYLYVVFYAFAEMFRGVYSCFMSYSCAKITKFLIPKYARITAQGLYNVCLLGLGSISSGLVGYYMLSNDPDQNYRPEDFKPFFMANLVVGLIGTILISSIAFRNKKHISVYG